MTSSDTIYTVSCEEIIGSPWSNEKLLGRYLNGNFLSILVVNINLKLNLVAKVIYNNLCTYLYLLIRQKIEL